MHRGSAIRRWGTRKKLSGRGPRHKLPAAPRAEFRLGGEDFELHHVTKVSQAFDQASFLLVVRAAVKMFATEVLIHRSILKHVVDGREDRGCDGHDSLLGTAPGFDSIKIAPAGSCPSYSLVPRRTV